MEAAEDRFELRLEGWRKFHMVALSDLLASEDSSIGSECVLGRSLESICLTTWRVSMVWTL